jgi:glycosyltransferase involved in cell wall biosynthesis
MRILFLNPSAAFGGASKSLIEMYAKVQLSGGKGSVVTPFGSATAAFRDTGLDVIETRGLTQFDNTRYGHYRGLRWLITMRELMFVPSSLHAVWRVRKHDFDLIHLNELTLLPLGILAKRLLRRPMVVHVRSLQRTPSTGWRTRWLTACLRRHADAIVAIDHTVAATLDNLLTVDVVHNGLRVSGASTTLEDGDVNAPVRIGFLGVLLPLKGIYELIETMRILKARGVRFECHVAGENPRRVSGIKGFILTRLGFARDVRAEVEAMIERYELRDQVKMLGFVSDVQALYRELDILCFPSHLNAAGRPVFEAALHSVPSVVVMDNPLPDAVVHGVTGLAVPRPDPELIADAIQKLAENAEYRRTLGSQARVWAEENFSIECSAEQMLEIYRRVLRKASAAAEDPNRRS